MKEPDWTGMEMLIVRGGKVYRVEESLFLTDGPGSAVAIYGHLVDVDTLHNQLHREPPKSRKPDRCHAKWCPVEPTNAYCSKCGAEGVTDMNYCPNCGAEMVGCED